MFGFARRATASTTRRFPHHRPLKIGTLNAILRNLAAHHHLERDDLLELLDL